MTDTSTPSTPGGPRSIELEIEVAGSPEEVWRAVATGPGISSWYVPHTVEERAGGVANASFGPGPEMQVGGRVVEWDPPRRIVFDGGPSDDGLNFEWLVEARDSQTCVVRLVNTGFGSGGPWDDQFDAMTDGWRMFLFNLQLHLAHFPGQTATSMLPMAMWSGDSPDIWVRLVAALGIANTPILGERIVVTASDAPPLAGTVAAASPGRLALLLDTPCPGTAFLAVEGTAVSIWSYLYGPDQHSVANEHGPLWSAWLAAHGNA